MQKKCKTCKKNTENKNTKIKRIQKKKYKKYKNEKMKTMKNKCKKREKIDDARNLMHLSAFCSCFPFRSSLIRLFLKVCLIIFDLIINNQYISTKSGTYIYSGANFWINSCKVSTTIAITSLKQKKILQINNQLPEVGMVDQILT